MAVDRSRDLDVRPEVERRRDERRVAKRADKARLAGRVLVPHPHAAKEPQPTRRDRRRHDSTAGKRARERTRREDEAAALRELREEERAAKAAEGDER